jgi:diadenosine tetraphosphatase ApaH/serine/threonine PP2A family protein phosphatase
MRYCIFSDVHGNWEAFEAVMTAFAKEDIDQHIFLGDIVGYGADPHACIAGLKALKPQVLTAGNHEWGVLGLLDMEYFNEYAAAAVEWTKNLLSQEELDYLKSFRLFCETGGLTLVHGSLEQPARFKYILDNDDADLSLRSLRTPLCFVGHTHVAGAHFFENGEVVFMKGPKVCIGADKKHIINAGSVGQPRDGDPRASYVIYDDKEKTVEIKRVSYDIEAAQKKIVKAGLPAWLASRLGEGR